MAGEADSRDLWGEALGQLSEEDRRVIEESQLSGNRLETLDHIRRAAEQEKQRCIEKGWSVYTTTSGKKIKLRHVLEKISAWVSELINVVNVAVAFDASGNAAAPWGVVKFLVGAATSNIAVFTDLGEGIELTTRLITRHAVIERLYLHDDVETTPHLTKHITEMYVSVLCYLSAAKKYFESGTIKKVGHGIRDFLTKEYKSLLESISEVEVEKWLRTADHLFQQKADKDAAERHRILKETLNRLDQPIMQMAVQLSAMQDQLDYGKRIEVFQWMSEIPYGSHFEQNSKSLPEDSGQWLLKSREFSDWSLSNESCVFWLSGPCESYRRHVHIARANVLDHGVLARQVLCRLLPAAYHGGFADNVRSSLVLKRLRRNSLYAGNACPIAFFYCSRNTIEPERADPDKILGALVKQLSGTEPSETIREPVAIEYNRRKAVADVDGQKPKPLDVEDCTKLITQLCNVNPAFVLVDALDECDESRLYELLESLDQIVSQSGETVKVFLSSRENIDVTHHIQLSKVIRSRIVPEKNCQDINTFIEMEVLRLHSKKLLLGGQISPKLRRKTIKKLQSGASGMFRWVTLSLETLSSSSIKHPKDYEKALGNLPPELFKLYDIIYDEMMESGENASRLVTMSLTLLLYARERLPIRRFLAAVSENVDVDDESDASSLSSDSATGSSSDSERYWVLSKEVFTPLQIVDMCRSFVTVDSEENVIRFAHPSVREFLVEKPQYCSANANSLLLGRCLDEVNSLSPAVQPNKSLTTVHVPSATEFSRYAAYWWTYHYKEASRDGLSPPIQRKLDEFLFESTSNKPSESYKQWLRTSHGLRLYVDSMSNAMMLASSLGWDTMVDDMIKRNIFNPDDPDAKGMGPLHTASRFTNLSTVQLLLKHGAHPNLKDNKGRTPLSYAVQGHEDITQLLLEHGAHPDLNDKSGRTPLSYAAQSGREHAVQLLLDTREVDPDSKGHRGYTPLMYGCESYSGEGAAMLLLRTPGVNPAYVAPDGESVLLLARWPSVIEELLKFDGIDINLRDRLGRTPLSRAAMDGHLDRVRFFLGKAATDRNAADVYGQTPIFCALKGRKLGAINLLLNDPAVELNAPDNSGRTALSYAAEYADDAVIETLLSSDKVDPNSRDHLGRSPLSWSVRKWRPTMDGEVEASIKALLADGRVDVDSRDNAGRTPISIAAENGYVEIINVLIETGKADTRRADNNGWTPLRWALVNGHWEVVAALGPKMEE